MIRISSLFYPKFKCNLIRMGKSFDGGYVVEKKSVMESKILVSFGISDDWSFEEDFSNLGDKRIYSYDYSVNRRFWITNFIKSILRIIFLKNITENFIKLFDYFKYKKFFDLKDNFHFKKFITSSSMKKNLFKSNINISLNETLKEIDKDIFLKIDIEGSEYRILDEIIKNSKKINGLVIEFHDFDLHYDLIKKFINDFDQNLIHIHVNNYGSINKEGLPSVVELSFASKFFVKDNDFNNKSYPVVNLDMPNNKDEIDCNITFY